MVGEFGVLSGAGRNDRMEDLAWRSLGTMDCAGLDVSD